VRCGLHVYIYISVFPSISPLVETVERWLVPNGARERRDRRHVEVVELGRHRQVVGVVLVHLRANTYINISPPSLETVRLV